MKSFYSFLLICFLLCGLNAQGQSGAKLPDVQATTVCTQLEDLIESRPKEILFGLDITPAGEVFFLMDSKEWFDKIFAIADGISADVVSKDNYRCGGKVAEPGLTKGYLLAPRLKKDFAKHMSHDQANMVSLNIGKLPQHLIGKELEANLIITTSGGICYYTSFVNIERALWRLLPMGLYTDTLNNQMEIIADTFALEPVYSREIQLTIPFAKGKSTFTQEDIQPLLDSINIASNKIRKVAIRAYASVDGPEAINARLMRERAAAITQALKKAEPQLQRIEIRTAENWVEFYQAIQTLNRTGYLSLTKKQIKEKLALPQERAVLDTLLAKHRKAVVTVYLESTNRTIAAATNNWLQEQFTTSIQQKNVQRARLLQKEIVDRITDNRLPLHYLNKLEIPQETYFSPLINDHIMYKYWLNLCAESEALQALRNLRKKDSTNGQINYNICALQMFFWQYASDSVNIPKLKKEILALPKQQVPASLVQRLLMNYHILLSNHYMLQGNYDKKDSALAYIKNNYNALQLKDEDLYSLAKYFSYYSQQLWALEIILPRIDQLGISEDILFYYINLCFYYPETFNQRDFKKVLRQAAAINPKRFCDFFTPNDKGGASIQMLDYAPLQNAYCETCKP